jgi:hypothetical protein
LGAVELSGWLEMVVGLLVVMVMMLAELGVDAAAGFGIYGFIWFGCSVRCVLWCCLIYGRGSERGGELRGGLVSV